MTSQAQQKGRSLWTEEQLQAAMSAVEGGWSVYKASKTYGIPRRTLRNHIKKGSRTKNTGHPTYLSSEQETELCSHVFKMCNTGMPLTAKLLRRTVYNYCILNKLKHPFSEEKGMAGRKWMQLFLKRNPNIAARWSLTRNPAIKLVINHYQKLRDILNDTDLAPRPEAIYNIGEKGCLLALYSEPARGKFFRKGALPGEVESVTIVACSNAAGDTIPPLIVFKGTRVRPEWYNNLPAGSEICVSARGAMTTNVFIKWVDHFSKFKSPGKSLLIYDGAVSQLDANIIDTADKNDITLCCLPSDLQPLDRSVFRSYESFWDEEAQNFCATNSEKSITRVDFSTIFGKVWPLCTTESNVTSGFRETGIYPFDPSVIPNEVAGSSEKAVSSLVQDGHHHLPTGGSSADGSDTSVSDCDMAFYRQSD